MLDRHRGVRGARELTALGHGVRLVPPSYVRAMSNAARTTDADAEAICEAVTRPNIRFVPVKRTEQQGVLVLHRAHEFPEILCRGSW